MGHTHTNENKTLSVVLITTIAMIVEIFFGITSNSMALLADGIHMGSHVLALGLSWLAYVAIRKISGNEKLIVSSKKILSLSGYSSGLMLLLFAFLIIYQSIERYFNPLTINYKEAIIVAVVGLVVNIICTVILHHDHKNTDHNIRAAYLHVIADTLTSISAIAGLTAAMFWDIPFVDSFAGLAGSLIIIRWSVGLLRDTGKVLLDLDK